MTAGQDRPKIKVPPPAIFLVLGMPVVVVFTSIWFICATVIVWLVLERFAVAPEELYLEQKFGEAYARYKAKIRRWF